VPKVTVNSPWGVRRRTTAPGTRSSWAVVSTVVCSAAWLIGLSADEPALEPGGGIAPAPGDAVGVDAVLADGVETVEHPASRRAHPERTPNVTTTASSPAPTVRVRTMSAGATVRPTTMRARISIYQEPADLAREWRDRVCQGAQYATTGVDVAAAKCVAHRLGHGTRTRALNSLTCCELPEGSSPTRLTTHPSSRFPKKPNNARSLRWLRESIELHRHQREFFYRIVSTFVPKAGPPNSKQREARKSGDLIQVHDRIPPLPEKLRGDPEKASKDSDRGL
jgi:hypothetical protein